MNTTVSVLIRVKLDKGNMQTSSFRSWKLGFWFCIANHYFYMILYEKAFSPTNWYAKSLREKYFSILKCAEINTYVPWYLKTVGNKDLWICSDHSGTCCEKRKERKGEKSSFLCIVPWSRILFPAEPDQIERNTWQCLCAEYTHATRHSIRHNTCCQTFSCLQCIIF